MGIVDTLAKAGIAAINAIKANPKTTAGVVASIGTAGLLVANRKRIGERARAVTKAVKKAAERRKAAAEEKTAEEKAAAKKAAAKKAAAKKAAAKKAAAKKAAAKKAAAKKAASARAGMAVPKNKKRAPATAAAAA